jgi:CheY-like chemotaxis protein
MPPSDELESPQTGDLNGVSVLVVEDDPASSKLLSVLLRGEGCQVQVAASAEDALDLLSTFRPRVIVIDLILPVMSGLVLAQQLEKDVTHRDAVLIAVTAFNGLEVQRLAREAGFVAYVHKPIDPLSFIQVLRLQLEGKNEHGSR